MRHNAVLDGDALSKRSDFIRGGLGFASSCLIKGRGWKHQKVVDDYHISEYIFYLEIYLSLFIQLRMNVVQHWVFLVENPTYSY